MTWPAGYDRRVVDHVDSTNSEAVRQANDLNGPCWILAHYQTSGRGRRGRIWHMPRGNFAATLVFRPVGAPAHVALRSFVASLALYDALVSVTGRSSGFSLKWPNDVLLNGGKVAGILLESVGAGSGVRNLAIGIGVNLIAAPGPEDVEAGACIPVDLASTTGALVTPEEFLEHLASAYARLEDQFTTYGFAPIRTAWLKRAARLGQVVTARTGTTEITGTFQTVDDTGALVLNTAHGTQAIAAADVYF
ncbi:MAG: biotin--[acetyl-CoA-carboxylase] ligase [Pseudoprimorskyibacter sp.]|nr:biotin--[acetyl-CoA-carboxylase] ligase [Pseudoprimorskyibacter sp.]